jgi:hypothetical protein
MRTNRFSQRWRVLNWSAMAAAIAMMVSVMLMTDAADAWPPYLNEWKDKYPDSTLPQRMEQQFGMQCFVCHNPVSFSSPGNCYREDLLDLLLDGYSILEALDIADGLVQTVRSIINPEKLRHLGPLADVRALLRGES